MVEDQWLQQCLQPIPGTCEYMLHSVAKRIKDLDGIEVGNQLTSKKRDCAELTRGPMPSQRPTKRAVWETVWPNLVDLEDEQGAPPRTGDRNQNR